MADSDSDKIAVGFDLGNSHTVITYLKSGSIPETLKSKTGDSLHHSAIYYNPDPEKENLFGKAAMNMLPDKNVVTCVKRALGITSGKIINKKLDHSFNAEMTTKGASYPKFLIKRNNGKEEHLTAQKITTDLLIHFRTIIHNELGDNVRFVVSMPEHWSTNSNKVLKAALHGAGFLPVLDTITEPAGAQFAYRAAAEPSSDQFMVLDIGDGTSDISLMQEKARGNYDTIAAGGSEFLGSRDIDRLLLEALEEEAKKEKDFNANMFELQKKPLLGKMREMKHKLSEIEEATETVFGITGTAPFVFKVDQNKKKVILAPFYAKLENAINKVFTDRVGALGGLVTDDQMKSGVDVVYLAGGGSRDPVVGDYIVPKILPRSKVLGRFGTPGAINPDVVVSEGCALWAATLMKVPTKIGLPEEAVHNRILPKNLGIEGHNAQDVAKGYFSIVIPANSVIPISKLERRFTTFKLNQPNFEVRVFQGEGDYTNDENVDPIGEYTVTLDVPNNYPSIEVEFTIEEDGCLTVKAGEAGKERKEMKITLNL